MDVAGKVTLNGEPVDGLMVLKRPDGKYSFVVLIKDSDPVVEDTYGPRLLLRRFHDEFSNLEGLDNAVERFSFKERRPFKPVEFD